MFSLSIFGDAFLCAVVEPKDQSHIFLQSIFIFGLGTARIFSEF